MMELETQYQPSVAERSSPIRFGIWEEDRESRALTTFLAVAEDYYQISFTVHEGRLESFSFSFYPYEGHETPSAAPLFPDFSISHFRAACGEKLFQQLFALNRPEVDPAKRLPQIITEILSALSFEHFKASPEILSYRLHSATPLKIRGMANAIFSYSDLDAEIGIRLVEACHDQRHLQSELIHQFVRSLRFFSESSRGVLASYLIEKGAVPAEVADIFALGKLSYLKSTRDCSPALGQALINYLMHMPPPDPTLCQSLDLRTAAALSNLLACRDSFREPETLYKHVIERLISRKAPDIIDHIQNEPFRRYLNTVTNLFDSNDLQIFLHHGDNKSLLRHPQLFSVTATEFVVEVLAAGKLDVLDERVNLSAAALSEDQLENCFARLRLVPEYQRVKTIAAILRHRHIARAFDDVTLANAALSAADGDVRIFEHGLDKLKGLSLAIALHITDQIGDHQRLTFEERLLFQNLGSFKLTRSEFRELIGRLEGRPFFISGFLDSLDAIPERYIGYLENDYRLQSYARECGLPNQNIYERYLALKVKDDAACQHFLREVRETSERLISAEAQTDATLEQPYINDLLQLVYPQAAKRNLKGALDRSADFDPFVRRSVYRMNLAEGVQMSLKEGAAINQSELSKIERLLERQIRQVQETGYHADALRELAAKNFGAALTPAREIYLARSVMTALSEGSCDDQLKSLLMLYQLTRQEQLENYLQCSVDRVQRTKNPEYAHLLELHEYFADKMRDAIKAVLQNAFQSEEFRRDARAFVQSVRRKEFEHRKQQIQSKFQYEKLGLSKSFRNRVSKVEEEQARAVSQKEREEATVMLDRMRAAECQRIAAFMTALSGKTVEAEVVSLERFDPKVFAQSIRYEEIEIDDELIVANFGERALHLFDAEVKVLGEEIRKYCPNFQRDRRARILEGFFTKNITSMLARGCGGVCVAGDSPPAHEPDAKSQWTLPNYLQEVLRDPETKSCVGVLLIHYYQEQGTRLLTVSFNPSSTYVYKVDEQGLFRALLGSVIEFASDNEIDLIVTSKQRTIRTNRTGGEFERALDSRVREVAEEFSLIQPHPFSFQPAYQQQHFDVLWKRESPLASVAV